MNGTGCEIDAATCQHVGHVKDKLEELEGIPAYDQELFLQGGQQGIQKGLDDSVSLDGLRRPQAQEEDNLLHFLLVIDPVRGIAKARERAQLQEANAGLVLEREQELQRQQHQPRPGCCSSRPKSSCVHCLLNVLLLCGGILAL
jgi:hypothetical protein